MESLPAKLQTSFKVSFNTFVPNAPFLYALKMFSGGRKRVHREQMG